MSLIQTLLVPSYDKESGPVYQKIVYSIMATIRIRVLLVSLMLGSFSLNRAIAQDKTSSKIAYYNKTKINFLSGGNNDDNDRGINLSTIHGAHVSDILALGVGIGITGGNRYPSTVIPVFLNSKLSLTNTRKLYISGDLGFSFATENAVKGGILGELSIGWKFRFGGVAIAPEIGYRYDGYKGKYTRTNAINGEYTYTDISFSNHINSLSAGLSLYFQ